MTREEILKEIKKHAKENGYKLTKYAERIAEAKRRKGFKWVACPCCQDGKHYCGSETCRQEIEQNGVCGCNLYMKGVKK